MPTVFGRDKNGHPYKSVDGKRVSTGLHASGRAAASNPDPINTLQQQWANNPAAGAKAVSQLIAKKFRLDFSIRAKASVGREAKLAAARAILKAMNEDGTVHRFVNDDGTLDTEQFVRHLHSKGVHVDEGESAAPPPNIDAELLAICHSWSLTPQQLTAALTYATRGHNAG